ncbi:MAG: hypothetical protein V9E98_08330 [Candidatus Nanopelagicales bacterium]
MPSTKTSCRSGTATSGAERKKAPQVAMELVTIPVRCFFHSSIAPVSRAEPRSDTPKVSVWLGTRQVCT